MANIRKSITLLQYVIAFEWLIIIVIQINFSISFNISKFYYSGLVLTTIVLSVLSWIVLNRITAKLSHQEVFLLMFMLIMTLFAYPIKQLWIYYDPTIMFVYSAIASRIDLSSSAVARYLWIEYIAIGMLLVGIFLCSFKKTKISQDHHIFPGSGYRPRKPPVMLITFTSFLILVLLLLMKKTGMYMGAGGVSLPFRLAGVILYAHLILVPMLILLCIFLKPQNYGKLYLIPIISMILLYIMGDMVVRLSRSSLLVFLMLLLGFIIASKPDQIKKFLRIGVISVGVTIFLMPIVTTLRTAQIHNDWSPAFISYQYDYNRKSVYSLFIMRITGAVNASMVMSNFDSLTLTTSEIMKKGVISYYTQNVLKYTGYSYRKMKTGYTPSALGECFILFGLYGGLLVVLLMPLCLVKMHRLLKKQLSFSYPLSYAFLFSLAIKSVTGGVFAKDVYTFVGAVILAWLIDSYFKSKAGIITPNKTSTSYRPKKYSMKMACKY